MRRVSLDIRLDEQVTGVWNLCAHGRLGGIDLVCQHRRRCVRVHGNLGRHQQLFGSNVHRPEVDDTQDAVAGLQRSTECFDVLRKRLLSDQHRRHFQR